MARPTLGGDKIVEVFLIPVTCSHEEFYKIPKALTTN